MIYKSHGNRHTLAVLPWLFAHNARIKSLTLIVRVLTASARRYSERVSEISKVMKIGHIESGFDLAKAKALVNVGKISEDACKACWAILHCTQCGAHADALDTLSKEKRLANCAGVKKNYLESLKDVCFLLQSGFDFNEVQ